MPRRGSRVNFTGDHIFIDLYISCFAHEIAICMGILLGVLRLAVLLGVLYAPDTTGTYPPYSGNPGTRQEP